MSAPGTDLPPARHGRQPRPTPGSNRFGLTVAALSLSLALATIVVIARGDQVGAAPLDVAPDHGAVDVSTRAVLRLRFAQPMKPGTVEPRLRLEPSIAGRFAWAGTTLTFQPAAPLQAATRYQVILEPGAEDARGRRVQAPVRWHFETRAPATVALRRGDTAANLWVVDAGAGAARPLTDETVDVIDFSIAPTGDRVAYTRQDSPARTSVWIVNVATGATTRLSADEAASFSSPAWAPDGDVLVVERRADLPGTVASPKLLLVRPDGRAGGLVYGRGDEVGFGARWSPDGTRLAFFDPVRQAVVISNFTPDRVMIPVQTTVAIAWSPDSRRLAIEDIVSDGTAFQHILLLADAATGATERLTTAPDLDEAAPAWAPDGRALAFTRRPTTGVIGGAQPVVLDLASGAPRPALAREERTLDTTALEWSPDGRRLLASRMALSDPGAEPEVAVIDFGTGTARRLGAGTVAAWLP